jgi:hypothetical protein
VRLDECLREDDVGIRATPSRIASQTALSLATADGDRTSDCAQILEVRSLSDRGGRAPSKLRMKITS